MNNAKIETVIIAGNNAAKERETAGGTPSGMLITRRGLPAKRRKISVEIIATINAKNNPCEPRPAAVSKPSASVAIAPNAKKLATEIAPAPNASWS